MPYPQTARSDYSYSYAPWQYTNLGTVKKIAKSVDMNVAYFRLDQENQAKGQRSSGADRRRPRKKALQEVQETVTAKIATDSSDTSWQ
ncbi:MAG: hypothetical protein V8S98_00455 [Lachnospiraceae bacterium]